MLTASDLKVGRVYRARRPSSTFVAFARQTPNDRQIVYIGASVVQYDGPTVKIGQRLPTVSKEAFLKWAAYDCTDEMPENGEWADWPLTKDQIDRCKEARQQTAAES